MPIKPGSLGRKHKLQLYMLNNILHVTELSSFSNKEPGIISRHLDIITANNRLSDNVIRLVY